MPATPLRSTSAGGAHRMGPAHAPRMQAHEPRAFPQQPTPCAPAITAAAQLPSRSPRSTNDSFDVRPSATARHPSPRHPIKERPRSGTSASARLACRPETGASSPSALWCWRRGLLPGSSGSRHTAPWCRGSFKSTSSAKRKPSRQPIADYTARPTHRSPGTSRVSSSRSAAVPADPVVVRQNWLARLRLHHRQGRAALNDYARTNDPFAKVGKAQISVEVSSVIRASRHLLPRRLDRAPLRERCAGCDRALDRHPHHRRATRPRDADRLRKNPLGIYVHAINWSKELG